jgi:hypothetical protein
MNVSARTTIDKRNQLINIHNRNTVVEKAEHPMIEHSNLSRNKIERSYKKDRTMTLEDFKIKHYLKYQGNGLTNHDSVKEEMSKPSSCSNFLEFLPNDGIETPSKLTTGRNTPAVQVPRKNTITIIDKNNKTLLDSLSEYERENLKQS